MKVFVVLCAFIVGILATTLPESEKSFLKQVHDTCQSKQSTHVDESLLKHMEENANDPIVMSHMLCMAQGTGMMTHDGTLNMDVVKSKMSMVIHGKHHMEKMMTKCAVQKNTPMTTAMDMWMCFFHNDIDYMHVI